MTKRVGDVAHLRSGHPPVPAIVLAVSPSRVRVGYYDDAGQVVRRWLEPTDLIQMTVFYTVEGIPPELLAIRSQ
jgi:hypothetical protein